MTGLELMQELTIYEGAMEDEVRDKVEEAIPMFFDEDDDDYCFLEERIEEDPELKIAI